MKKLLPVVLLFVITTLHAQPKRLDVYLDVNRSQNMEYNYVKGKDEIAWDLPTEREIRKQLQERMVKENFWFEIIRRESDAAYIVEMYGDGWIIMGSNGRAVREKKNAAFFSNTIKDIVQGLKSIHQ